MSNALYCLLFVFLMGLDAVIVVLLANWLERFRWSRFHNRSGFIGLLHSMIGGLCITPFFILFLVFIFSAGCYMGGDRVWHCALGIEKWPYQIAKEEMGEEESEIRGHLNLELQVLSGFQRDMEKAVYTPHNQVKATEATKRYLAQFDKAQKIVEKLKSLPPHYCPCSKNP